jgi:hypothetical protein
VPAQPGRTDAAAFAFLVAPVLIVVGVLIGASGGDDGTAAPMTTTTAPPPVTSADLADDGFSALEADDPLG